MTGCRLNCGNLPIDQKKLKEKKMSFSGDALVVFTHYTNHILFDSIETKI
jgi:hypothetical protein